MALFTQPEIITYPFSVSGSRNTIPATTQNPGEGFASQQDGFPAETQLPIAAGGIPPRRADFNGILYVLSTLQYFLQQGPMAMMFSNVVAANGGYPKGAVLRSGSPTDGRFFVNDLDGNTVSFENDPTTIGNTWLPMVGLSWYAPGQDYVMVGQFVIGQDLECYRCIRANGPSYGGAQPPPNPTYWETLADYIYKSNPVQPGNPGDYLATVNVSGVPTVIWQPLANQIKTIPKINFSMAKTINSQLVPSNGTVQVAFDTKVFDDTNLSAGTGVDIANSRWVCPQAGKYMFSFSAVLQALGGTATIALYIRKNGSPTPIAMILHTSYTAVAQSNPIYICSGFEDFVKGDIVTAVVTNSYQNSGGGLTLYILSASLKGVMQ